MADAFVEAWAASASDKARIEAFAGWLKARRPLDAGARHAAFRLRAALATLDEEARACERPGRPARAAGSPPPPPPRSPPRSGSASALCRSAYSAHEGSDDIWLFGYGSILWRQGFEFERALVGHVRGYARRFHLGDTAHRGVPGAPGRAVTLEAGAPGDVCWGCAFLLPAASAARIVEGMDVREAAYEKRSLDLYGRVGAAPVVRDVIAYVVADCPAKRAAAGYLGPAPVAAIAATIAASAGPSGPNADYLKNLDAWLLDHGVEDDHVRSVARAVHGLEAARAAADGEARVGDDGGAAAAPGVRGRVVVDAGAAEVVSNCARSLLAVGVVDVVGDFAAGDAVAVETARGAVVARGAASYAAADLRLVRGCRSARCAALLPAHPGEPGVVVAKGRMTLA